MSPERIAELAQLGPAIDGHEVQDPAKNARIMKYQRESPPLSESVRGYLDGLQTIRGPARPGVYLLWHVDRVVYVGRSAFGIFGHTISDHHHGARYGVLRKEFDRISFLQLHEGVLDLAVRALVDVLRPKYNRTPKPTDPDVARSNRRLLKSLGFPFPDDV